MEIDKFLQSATLAGAICAVQHSDLTAWSGRSLETDKILRLLDIPFPSPVDPSSSENIQCIAGYWRYLLET